MKSHPAIDTQICDTAKLSQKNWDELWDLTREFYDIDRPYAESELRRRQRIAMFRMDGTLLGMAAIDVVEHDFRGRKVVVLSTTNVLIREHWRGRNLIQKLGFRTFLGVRLRFPLRPIYWFFDSFSYKSYLLLPRNFHTYWPRYDAATPEASSALIDELATRIYGPAWRPARGIVVRSGQKRLRATAAPLELAADSDPNLRFFGAVNPGHAEGDMLVCLCPLTPGNWLSVARRAFARLRRFGTH
jgi:hypothetical protein